MKLLLVVMYASSVFTRYTEAALLVCIDSSVVGELKVTLQIDVKIYEASKSVLWDLTKSTPTRREEKVGAENRAGVGGKPIQQSEKDAEDIRNGDFSGEYGFFRVGKRFGGRLSTERSSVFRCSWCWIFCNFRKGEKNSENGEISPIHIPCHLVSIG